MKTNYIFGLIAAIAVTLIAGQSRAQNVPLLERTVTITLSQERLDDALKKISRQGGFTFSYSPSILDAGKIVSYNFVNKTVREILDELFNGALQYKARGKYIILTKAQLSSTRQSQILTGYVVDEATGERLKDVTVYDPVTLTSTLTDSYGYFEIKVEKPPADLTLSINKRNYGDTLVTIPVKNGKLLNIPMKVRAERLTTFADSVGKRLKRFWNTKVMAHRDNVSDTLHRKTQLSFVPFLGTNHALSANVINDYSFNVIGGYSLGVEKLEIGSVFNIVEGNVKGAQLAGVFNAVGGDVKGAQFAGIFNAAGGTVEGAQLAGMFNFNWQGSRHFSGAGIFNFSRRYSRAIQLAGMMNITIGEQESPHLAGLFNFTTGNAGSQIGGMYNFAAGGMKGWQLGGMFNVAAKDVEGMQTAGMMNITGKSIKGAQIAGIFNVTGKNVHGAQVAGVFNIAGGEVRGAQVGSVLNYATRVRGAQIGLINIADSVGGVPFGLLSIVLKGYHKIDISADEIFHANVSFRTGVRKFHNILTIGARTSTLEDTATHWTFGYGFGTAPKLSSKFYLNIDLTSNQIVEGATIDKMNMLNKLYVGVEYQLLPKMSVFTGLTWNIYTTDTSKEGYRDLFEDYKPDFFYNRTHSNDLNTRMWLGAKIGLRFL